MVSKSQRNLFLLQPERSFEERCRTQSSSNCWHRMTDRHKLLVLLPSPLHSLLMSTLSLLLSFFCFFCPTSKNPSVLPFLPSSLVLFTSYWSAYLCQCGDGALPIQIPSLLLSEMIVHLLHHLPHRKHNDYLKFKRSSAPPTANCFFTDFASKMTTCRAAGVSRVSAVWACFEPVLCVNSGLAHLGWVPEESPIQKQKLINQPSP